MRNTILVVDDHEPMRAMIGQVLRNAGYTVIDAPDGSNAVALAEHHKVALVVMDLIMPERDGFETLVEFKRDCPKIPVIAMSAFGTGTEVNYLKTALALGARDLLQKPFTAEQLLTVVRQFVPKPPAAR